MSYALHSLAMAFGFLGLVFLLILLHGVLHADKQASFLTDSQKDDIRTSFKNYYEAGDVNLDDPRWLPGLGLYVALGMMTQEEVTEVLYG